MSNIIPMQRLMQGNEAVAEGALAAGVRFFAGYPITPSTEIAEILAEKLPAAGGKFIQMEDEIAGMAAVIGGSLAGAKALTATSGPGFSLKQENIGFAVMAEVPCVVVNVQRSGPSTGMPTSPSQGDVMQARWGTHGDHPMIVLSPTSVREAYEITVTAVNYAEKYRTPVVLLLDEVVGHMRERVEIPAAEDLKLINRKQPKDISPENYLAYRTGEDLVPALADFGTGYRYHVTGLTHDESGFPTNNTKVAAKVLERLHRKIEDHLDDISISESYLTEDADVLVIAYGGTARSARRAVKNAREQGLKAGLWRPVSLWPFPERHFADALARCKKVVVAEMNRGQYQLEIERQVQGKVPVVGVNCISGELITPDEIVEAIKTICHSDYCNYCP